LKFAVGVVCGCQRIMNRDWVNGCYFLFSFSSFCFLCGNAADV